MFGKRLFFLLILGIATLAVAGYLLPPENSTAFLGMMLVYSSLYLAGRQSSIIIAVAASVLVIIGGMLNTRGLDIFTLWFDRFFTLLSLGLTLVLVLWLKKSRSALESQKNLLEDVFDQISEGIVLVGLDGKISRANKAASRMFGYDPVDLTGRAIETLIPERFAAHHVAHRDGFSRQPRSRKMGEGFDLFARRHDNSEFPVAISLSPLEFEGKKFVMAFILDITERKAYEESLLKQKSELENLANRLRTSNTELENFAYVSSHDLQEPLRKILAFSDMLLSSEINRLSTDGISLINRIQNGATRMQTLISDLLAFSRLNSHPPQFQAVNIQKAFNEVLADLEISIRETGAEIRFGKLPEKIEADPALIRQLFQNLLSNALKFRRENEPPLVEIFSENAEAQGMLEIHVRDNGIGFDEKYLDKIFTIFKRLGGVTYPGTGIGLAICKKIVEYHGGTITAKSSPGKGAEFIATLRHSAINAE